MSHCMCTSRHAGMPTTLQGLRYSQWWHISGSLRFCIPTACHLSNPVLWPLDKLASHRTTMAGRNEQHINYVALTHKHLRYMKGQFVKGGSLANSKRTAASNSTFSRATGHGHRHSGHAKQSRPSPWWTQATLAEQSS